MKTDTANIGFFISNYSYISQKLEIMTPKEKAKGLLDRYYHLFSVDLENTIDYREAKQCALIALQNEYHSLREMLFNLRSCHVIESEKVYLFRLQKLIDEENEVKQEIESL